MSDLLPIKKDIAAFLKSDHLAEITAKVLLKRLEENFLQPLFFSPSNFHLLGIIAQILMGEDTTEYNNKMAGSVDRRLYLKQGDGWRYDEMPPDEEAYVLGLKGIEQTALYLFKNSFQRLSFDEQNQVLTNIQKGTVPRKCWPSFSAKLFFEEILAEITEIYYSLPEIQLEIGYAGMADHHGWSKIKTGETEAVEMFVKKEFQQKKDA